MNKNLDLIAKELYSKIYSYPNLTMTDDEGNEVETDQSEAARKFNFEYQHKGQNLATITINLNDGNDESRESFEVLISNDPVDAQQDYVKKLFLNFGKEMREFAKQHMLTFNIHVATRSNKERDSGESIMSESKLFGTAKTSYQKIGEATLIIKHRDFVNQENPAGRTQRIESIYVENAEGERFKYPHRHLNGARALAQHVAHGGNLYDNIGQYMVGLSEELSRLRMFKGYVDRNDTISEAMGSIHSKVLERIDQVKKEIQHLQRPSVYEEFAESFTEQQSVNIPEDVMNDWIDRLTIRTFNEELKNVFPYIFKLISEDDIPVKELSVEDLIQEEEDEEDETKEKNIPEFAEYEQYLNQIVETEEGVFSLENEDAIAELNELLSAPMPLGVDGTNVVQSLEGFGFDEDFINGLQEMAKDESSQEMDARPFIKEYIKEKDEEMGTDILSQLNFDEEEMPEPQMTPEPETGMNTVPEPEAGVNPNLTPSPETGMNPAPKPMQESTHMFDELKEFVLSMYNEDEGNFPKGVEGVKIACEKKFGDRVGPFAAKMVERMTAIGEMQRIKQLAGVQRITEATVDDNWVNLPPHMQALKMDPDKMMKHQFDLMMKHNPTLAQKLNPYTMADRTFARMAANKEKRRAAMGNTPPGDDSFTVNGQSVSKDEYDQFMTQNPQLSKMMKDPMSAVQGNPELDRITKMAGVPRPAAQDPRGAYRGIRSDMPAGQPQAAATDEKTKDPKGYLKKMTDQQLAALPPEDAKKLLANIKKAMAAPGATNTPPASTVPDNDDWMGSPMSKPQSSGSDSDNWADTRAPKKGDDW